MPLTKSARTALMSIVRHRGASIVAVATLAFMLSALTIFILIATGLGNAATGLDSKANLIADLEPATSRSQVSNLEATIEAHWKQARLTYVTKDQALAQFRKTFAGNATMLSALEGNPLPASIQVQTTSPLLLNKISAALSRDPRIQRVIFNPNLTHKLAEITSVVTVGGIAVILGLAFLALVIVVNTTHLTLEGRRDEIEVMKLVGATHAFVRNPLMIEGVLLGLGGAALATVVGMGVFLPVLTSILGGTSSYSSLLPISTGVAFLATVGGVVMLIGTSIGALGSYVSVRRFAGI